MTLDDIIDALVVKYGLNRFEAKDLCEVFFADIKTKISNNERVRLAGLGTFSLKTQPYQRKRRDIPVTEDTPPWRTVHFTPHHAAKSRVQRALHVEQQVNEKDDQEFSAHYAKLLEAMIQAQSSAESSAS